MRKLSFLAGFGAGYVLGARAGRQRYEQIATAARSFMDNPKVQETTGRLQSQGTELAGTVKEKVTGKIDEKRSGGSEEPEVIAVVEVEQVPTPGDVFPAAGDSATYVDVTTPTANGTRDSGRVGM